MRKKRFLFGCLVSLVILSLTVKAQAEEDALFSDEGRNHEEFIWDLSTRSFSMHEVRRAGLVVFTTPFTEADGFGDGPNGRPYLGRYGVVPLRVNGLDAHSCNECHSVVSNRTRPPTLGIGGVGGVTQNAIIMPSFIDVADSNHDGIAGFNGRYSNPPFLFGGGGVEALAKEMTVDLQELLDIARSSPDGTVIDLDTHGVNFGSIKSLGGGAVDLSGIEGIGPEDLSTVTSLESEEEALVVRPFGRKGERFSMRDFDRGAMQFHFGIQPVEVVGPDEDEDGDDVPNEITEAAMTALHIFSVTNPRPRAQLTKKTKSGSRLFNEIGCSECHIAAMKTYSRFLPLAHPENPTDPEENVYLEIDLVKVGFQRCSDGGVYVPLYADLKRHDMGPDLSETLEGAGDFNSMFTTARLWGIADTAPYLHDGRATTLYEAIEWHGGEAQDARDEFLDLHPKQQAKLLKFFDSLRTPKNPNKELIRRTR